MIFENFHYSIIIVTIDMAHKNFDDIQHHFNGREWDNNKKYQCADRVGQVCTLVIWKL